MEELYIKFYTIVLSQVVLWVLTSKTFLWENFILFKKAHLLSTKIWLGLIRVPPDTVVFLKLSCKQNVNRFLYGMLFW